MSGRHFSLGEIAKAFGGQMGSWSPQLHDDSGSPSEGQTYDSATSGKYLRIGNLVYVEGHLKMTGLGTLTGGQAARLGNFPFSMIGVPSFTVGFFNNVNLPVASPLLMFGNNGVNYANLRYVVGVTGTLSVTVSAVTASGDIIFSGWYITNDAP